MGEDQALADFQRAASALPSTMSPTLTYIARKGERPHVIKARIAFHDVHAMPPPKLFEGSEIIAQTFALSILDTTAQEVITAALGGKVETPEGEFALVARDGSGFATTFLHLHPEVLAQHSRTGVLQIRGTDQSDHLQNPLLDWSLRAAATPYDSLAELSIDFGLGALVEQSTILEAVVGTLVAVDLRNQISDGKATIGVLAVKGLERERISLGYRVLDKGAVAMRNVVAGGKLQWIGEWERDVGTIEIDVPPGALVNCYANYRDVTYHSGWIVDPALTQNPRRSAYERFDPALNGLMDLLQPKDRRAPRDFEAAIAWLLWMLGFDTCHLGVMKKLQDGPDVLGTTQTGHMVVIECTTGSLKADSKMVKLLARTAAVREQLAKSGHAHLRVLPVMATTLPRAGIAAETGDAVANGVYVLCGNDFEEAIVRTLLFPDADRLFVEAERSLQSLPEIASP